MTGVEETRLTRNLGSISKTQTYATCTGGTNQTKLYVLAKGAPVIVLDSVKLFFKYEKIKIFGIFTQSEQGITNIDKTIYTRGFQGTTAMCQPNQPLLYPVLMPLS